MLLNDLTFEIEAGELVAVFGPSGSGKSLLIKTLWLPGERTVGEVEYQDLATTPPFPSSGFRRTTTPASFLKRYADSWSRVAYLLEFFGLTAKARQPVQQLSEGEQAALQIATTFSVSAKLYLLDTPFEKLDFERRRRLWQEIDERCRFGSAVLLTTRDPGIAERADRVLLLHEGTLIADMPPDELLRSVSPSLIEIEADEQEHIAHLLPPVEVEMKEEAGGVRMALHEGDEMAMRLLREGLGQVRCLYWRQPTLADAWHLLVLQNRR